MSATTETDEGLTVDAELVGKPCSYCGKPCEGHFAIHRDGFCVGPEVPLCDEHGGSEEPTVEAIWARLALLRAATMTDPPMAGVNALVAELEALVRAGEMPCACGAVMEMIVLSGKDVAICAARCGEWPAEKRRLAEIRTRAKKATGGQWTFVRTPHDERPTTYEVCDLVNDAYVVTDAELNDFEEDGRFIAHARQDVPWLVDRVEKLEVALEAERSRASLMRLLADPSSRVSIDPKVCDGEPCITGTEIPTKEIAEYHFAGYDLVYIRAQHPGITVADIEAAVAFEQARPARPSHEVNPETGMSADEMRAGMSEEGRTFLDAMTGLRDGTVTEAEGQAAFEAFLRSQRR